MDLEPLLEVDAGQPLANVRVAPVRVAGERWLLFAYSGHPNVDPYVNYFTFPEDSLKLALVDPDGTRRWERDLGPTIPGIWFCPVLPFDLDDDGVEEVWYVRGTNDERPLDLDSHELVRVDPLSGNETGAWDWPYRRQELSHTFRNFLAGGHADGDPVLVTAQGTYGPMWLQGYSRGMEPRWETHIAADDPGARGSHMCPVLDIDGDGDDELLWGERCLSLADGRQQWCADRETWTGHSDIVQPTLVDGEWLVYTCRETDTDHAPRVVTYDEAGERVWSVVDRGHMHVGWTACLDGERVAMAGRDKNAPHDDLDEFGWRLRSGEPYEFGFPVYSTLPVDLDGDGDHELVYQSFGRDGRVVDADGTDLGSVDEHVVRTAHSKLLARPGEQVVSYTGDGRIRVWGDRDAADGSRAEKRYDHPYYRKAQRLGAVGYNWRNLGGL